MRDFPSSCYLIIRVHNIVRFCQLHASKFSCLCKDFNVSILILSCFRALIKLILHFWSTNFLHKWLFVSKLYQSSSFSSSLTTNVLYLMWAKHLLYIYSCWCWTFRIVQSLLFMGTVSFLDAFIFESHFQAFSYTMKYRLIWKVRYIKGRRGSLSK